MTAEIDVLQQWIKPGSRVLDLGCGDGRLLQTLSQQLGVEGYGLEIDPLKINLCIERGINVIEQDLDQGLQNFATDSFDTVIMTQTLQAVHFPHLVLEEMLRVGKQGIITFPNFAHWRCRVYLSLRGRMPVSRFMPYTWYDTPNIHFCTVDDFEQLCADKNIQIMQRSIVDEQNRTSTLVRTFPNMFGLTARYHISR